MDAEPGPLADRRQALAPGPWTWLRQVHGAAVVEVDVAGAFCGYEADGAVTTTAGAVLAVQTADCAPVVLVADGVVALAHAGWRGLVAGILPATVRSLRKHTTAPVTALLGPVIRPGAYEFGAADLAEVERVAGPAVRASTDHGSAALDVAAAVTTILATAGVTELIDLGIDTADGDWFSHRVRGDTERQVTTVVLEPVP